MVLVLLLASATALATKLYDTSSESDVRDAFSGISISYQKGSDGVVTITLNGDGSEHSPIWFMSGTWKLNMNGHTLTGQNEQFGYGATPSITVHDTSLLEVQGATLTVVNGTLIGGRGINGVDNKIEYNNGHGGCPAIEIDYGNLYLESCTLTGGAGGKGIYAPKGTGAGGEGGPAIFAKGGYVNAKNCIFTGGEGGKGKDDGSNDGEKGKSILLQTTYIGEYANCSFSEGKAPDSIGLGKVEKIDGVWAVKGSYPKIPEGQTITVKNGETLSVPEGTTLTVNGTIQVEGSGTVKVNGGTIQGSGAIQPENKRLTYSARPSAPTYTDANDSTGLNVISTGETTIEYSINQKDWAVADLQSNFRFANLNPATAYTIYVRYKASNFYRSDVNATNQATLYTAYTPPASLAEAITINYERGTFTLNYPGYRAKVEAINKETYELTDSGAGGSLSIVKTISVSKVDPSGLIPSSSYAPFSLPTKMPTPAAKEGYTYDAATGKIIILDGYEVSTDIENWTDKELVASGSIIQPNTKLYVRRKGTKTLLPSDSVSFVATRLATVTVTVNPKNYDGTTEANLSVSTGVDGLTVTGLTGAYDTPDAGTGKTVTLDKTNVKLSGTNASMYELAIPDTVKGTINPLPLTEAMVTLTPATTTYNEQTQNVSVTVKANGATLTQDVDYTLSGTLSAKDVSPESGYGVTVTAKNPNYSGSITKYWKITPAEITGIQAEDYSGTYDGQSHSIALQAPAGMTVTYSTDGVDYSETLPMYKNAMSSPATVYYRVAKTGYQQVDGSKTVTIQPKGLSVALTPGGGTYGGTIVPASVILTGQVSGETVEATLTYTGTANNGTPVNGTTLPTLAGSYTVKVSISDTNYRLESGSTSAAFTVAKAQVTPPTIQSKGYNGQNQKADVSDTAYYTIVENNGGIAVSQYPVKLKLRDAANHCWTDADTAEKTLYFHITKVANRWTTTPALSGWVYGSKAQAPVGAALHGTVKVGYAKAGETSFVSTVPTDAGDYQARFTVAATDDYGALTQDVPFTITKRTVGLNWSNTALTYNGSSQGPSAQPTGLATGDSCTVTVTGWKTGAGTYTATATALSNANYQLPKDVTCSFTISKAGQDTPAGVGVENETIFGKADGCLTGVDSTMEYRLASDESWTEINVNRVENLPAGAYQVRVREKENHSASPCADVTIAAGRKLTLSFDGMGGTDTLPMTGLSYQQKCKAPAAPYRQYHWFLGWNTQQDGKGTMYQVDEMVTVTEDITLYAQWEAVEPVRIATHPTEQRVIVGEKAAFSVTAAGEDPEYQWYVDCGDGAGFTPIPEADEATLTLNGVELAANGYQYRCRVSNRVSEAWSDPAELKVFDVPQTGDTSPIGLHLALCLLSLTGLALCLTLLLHRTPRRHKAL